MREVLLLPPDSGRLFRHAETGHFEIGKVLISAISRRGILPRPMSDRFGKIYEIH